MYILIFLYKKNNTIIIIGGLTLHIPQGPSFCWGAEGVLSSHTESHLCPQSFITPAIYNHCDPLSEQRQLNALDRHPRVLRSQPSGSWRMSTFNSVSLHSGGMVLGLLPLKFPVYAVVICDTL